MRWLITGKSNVFHVKIFIVRNYTPYICCNNFDFGTFQSNTSALERAWCGSPGEVCSEVRAQHYSPCWEVLGTCSKYFT